MADALLEVLMLKVRRRADDPPIVMAGLVPAIHVFLRGLATKTWMPATSAGMTMTTSRESRLIVSPLPQWGEGARGIRGAVRNLNRTLGHG